MNLPHRILVVGAGSIGERHLRCLLATGRATVGVVEINPELRQQVAARYELSAAFGALADALAQPWEAAVVATPAPCHVSQAAVLAAAGLHLFIEKPLSISAAGVAELSDTVRHKGLVATVGYTWRAQPALAAMRREVVAGRWGRPLQVVAVGGQHFPSYRPAYRQTYYADRAAGGGAVQDALTHLLNAGEWLVGPIDRLCADAAHQSLADVRVEDTVHVLTRQGAVLGSYCLNQYQAPNETTITVVGERGTARFEWPASRWRWLAQPGGEWRDEEFPLPDRDAWFVLQEAAFLDALEGKAAPLCSLAEGWQTLRANLAVLRSADQQAGWVTVEPVR